MEKSKRKWIDTLILDADDTDITLINNELVRDALLLMRGVYYVTMYSEAAHSTLTPSQRLVLLTGNTLTSLVVPNPLWWMGVLLTGR